MALVSVADLKAYMSGIKMTAPQLVSVQEILDGVQNELEQYINRPLEARAVREAIITDRHGHAVLSESPVREIRTLRAYSGTAYSPDFPLGVIGALDPMPEYVGGRVYDHVPTHNGSSLIVPGGALLGMPETYFVVDYIAGGGDFIAKWLPSIRMGILRVAAREFQVMHDDTISINNGSPGEPVDKIAPMAKGWAEEELVKFDRIRRRVVV